MSKNKIRKNLSDEEMFGNYKEEVSFENTWLDEEITKPAVKTVKKESEKEGVSSFFTPELQEQVGKALLELKLQLYKEGIIDYDIKVTSEGKQVILTAVQSSGKKKAAAKKQK